MNSDSVLAEMEFSLLGPLLVRIAGTAVPVPAGKQRAVLAALLFNANRVLGSDELTDRLWGQTPPPSARVSLQNHVVRLRKSLGKAGAARIRTHPGGYLISVQPGELDVSRFEGLLDEARAAASEQLWRLSAARAGEALTLWRGEPLTDLGSDALALLEAPRLTEMRLEALTLRISADIQLGRNAGAIGELRQLASLHPLRERLHELLMLALYRDGRQAEALDAYRRAREVLVAELGTEPGARLRELQLRILGADHQLAAAVPAGPAAAHAEPVIPRQLPGTVRQFTGRAEELTALTRLLDRTDAGAGGPVVISAIGGTAGVGKTALAVHWANEVADRFPDGQLYVNLRGYDPEQPMSAGDALAGFLRGLGVPAPDIPVDTDERAARFRSLLAGRRILVVLDNARSAEQVRPLLSVPPGCLAVVTSRDALAGLVAREGAIRLDLDPLPEADAVGLLRALIGDRATADQAATEALAAQCCRLPLALRVAAELAVSRRDVPLGDLVGELADQQQRLSLLDAGGDPGTAVRAVFSWSSRQLDDDAARMFRLVGLHPGASLDCYAAAALAGGTVAQARRLLDGLARAYLIQAVRPGRYGMHDLLRAYACDLVGCAERQAALVRLFDYYLYVSSTAMDAAFPAERQNRPQVPPVASAPALTDPAQARAWLDTERDSLVASIVHAAANGWQGHAMGLAAALDRYLHTGGHYPEIIVVYTWAADAARKAGDPVAQAQALRSLGVADLRQARYQQATERLGEALALYRSAGYHRGEARTLVDLGIVDFRQGRHQEADDNYRRALVLYREAGDQSGEALTLGNLAGVDYRQGRYQQAASSSEQSLSLFREIGDRHGEAYTLSNLGGVYLRQGRYQEASRQLRQALVLCRENGHREGEASVLSGLGEVDLRQGRYQESTTHLRLALALFRKTGNRSGEVQVLNSLGGALIGTGEAVQAGDHYAAALALARQIGDTYEQAAAHNGLGRVHDSAGDASQAREHWRQALDLFTRLGAPEADQVRAQLADVRLLLAGEPLPRGLPGDLESDTDSCPRHPPLTQDGD